MARLTRSLQLRNIQILQRTTVESISFEKVTEFFRQSSANADAIIGFGGGKALDVVKYLAFLFQLPYLSVPTSLSNDGFCSLRKGISLASYYIARYGYLIQPGVELWELDVETGKAERLL